MATMYLAQGFRDASETSYQKVYSKLFHTKPEAEKALEKVWAHVKHVTPVEVG